MAIAYVNNSSIAASGASVSSWTFTPGWTPAVGETLKVELNGPSTANDISSLAYTGVSSWTLVTNNSTNRKSRTYLGVVSSTASGNVTVTQSSSAGAGTWAGNIAGFTGLPLTNGGLVTAQSNANTGTGTAVTTSTVTPPATRDAVVFCMMRGAGTAPAAPTGYTAFSSPETGGLYCYKIISAASSTETCAGTWSSSGNWIAHITTLSVGVLALTQQPTDAASGAAFSPVVTVAARTDGTNVDTGITADCAVTVASGGGSMVGTTTRAAVSGVSTFTGSGVTGSGAHTLTYTMLGFMPVTSSSFTVSAPVVACNIISAPLYSVNGAAMTFSIERTTGGVRDSFTGTATLSKISGGATLGGTLTSAAFVAGLGSLTTPTLTSSSGNHVLRVTLSSGETADCTVMLMKAAYSALGTQDVTVPFRDTLMDELQHFEPTYPSHITVGTPVGVIFLGNAANEYNFHAPGGVQDGPSRLRTLHTFGIYMDANKSSGFPYIFVSMPLEQNNDDSKAGWYARAHVDVVNILVAAGYNIDTKNIHFTGYSTSAILMAFLVAYNPTFWAALSGVDGTMISGYLTDDGNGPNNYGPVDGSFNDLTGADVSFFVEMGRIIEASGASVYYTHGTEGITYLGRDIRNMTPLFNGIDTAVGGTSLTTRYTGTTSTSQMASPYNPYVYELYDGSAHDHSAMYATMWEAANVGSLLAWHAANARTPAGGGAFARRTRARRIIAVEGA